MILFIKYLKYKGQIKIQIALKSSIFPGLKKEKRFNRK